MCDNWKNQVDKYSCGGVVVDGGDGEFVVKGKLKTDISNAKLLYYAPNPPTYCSSYSGSGLPYPNPSAAFENTPNKGAVIINSDGKFSFRVRYPNSYYTGLGSVYVPPHVFVKVCGQDKIHTIELGNGIPFRLLSYPFLRKNVQFYNTKGRNMLPPRTQERILRDSGYPNKNEMPLDFWGKAISHS